MNRPTNLRKHPSSVQLVSGKKEGLMSGVLGSAMPYRRHIIIFFDRIEMMQDAFDCTRACDGP